MEDDIAIKVEHVSKTFRLPHDKQNSIKGGLINWFKSGRRTFETQEVLRDVSFEIKKGEFFGIVGRNGSGKSTLLKVLAGIYMPTSGKISINGSLTPFIELGVGFNPELTGRENVFLNGALLGFNREEMEDMYDGIVEFAELERFMDQKLKNYSSGMQVRLAFSIAIQAKSDILLLDEVLAVGDVVFQKKCYDYFRQLKKEKRTVVLVSHDSSVLQEYCDAGILIEHGKIVKKGNIRQVVNKYLGIVNKQSNKDFKREAEKKTDDHIGSGEVTISKFSVSKDELSCDDSVITYKLVGKAHSRVDGLVIGITILNESGQPIFASNNLWLEKPVSVMPGQTIVATWDIPNIFNDGMHTIVPTFSMNFGRDIIDQTEAGGTFEVKKQFPNGSYTNPKHDMKVTVD